MNPNNETPQENVESSRSLLQKLKDGTITFQDLDEDDRLECVHVLRLSGYTSFDIAPIIKMSDRQVRRYTKKLQERHALNIDKNFSKEFLGDIKQQVLNSVSNLIKIAGGKEASTAEKIQATVAAGNLLFELAKLLQSTGHLTLQPQAVDANIFHHIANFNKQDILDIESAAKESIGLPEKVSKVLTELKAQLETPSTNDLNGKEQADGSDTT